MPRHLTFRLSWSLLLAGCGDGSGPDLGSPPAGTFTLASLDVQPLPARVPCGGADVLAATIDLTADRRASYTRRERANGGSEVTFTLTGTARVVQSRDRVELAIRGPLSSAPGVHDIVLRLRR